jgi:hypothetical protein
VITIVCGLVHELLEAKGLNESQKIIGIRVSGWSANIKIGRKYKVSGYQ